MQYRTFGKLDWQVSALGFGCMRFPTKNDDSSNIDEPEATRMLHYAIDHGVNYLDTAYPYHGGNSELFLGRALKGGYREKVKLATKLPCWKVEAAGDFTKFLNEQLFKLQTDHIDFYLLHALNEKNWHKVRDLGVIEWAEGAITDGRIGYLGFSFHDKYEVFQEIVDAYDGWTFCQIQYNYMDVENQAGVKGLKYAASKGLAVVIMEPILGGRLVNPPQPIQDLWDAAAKKRAPADWALQWLWNQPEVSVVLSGMSTMQQVEENVASAGASGIGTLTEEELALVTQVSVKYRELCPIPCTKCGYCMPCPNGVNIPRNFELYNQGMMYDKPDQSREAYTQWFPEPERADKCIQCRECEEKCPQSIPISEWMPVVHAVLGDGQPYAPTQSSQDFFWWQRGVVYQIYPRSFRDTTGNGVGDLQGVIDRLDYLNDGTEASLGIDALWLSPIFPSPMADFGYDVSDYCDVEPLFGDLATFDRLVAEAHRRGIRVIIDYVPNHSSDQHPWFIESRRSRDNPKRDWYLWRDPKPDGSPPNNWGSYFGGPAWTLDEATGQYYLHQFVKEQPELNWRNPEVRAAMMDVLRFWMERGVDGFRMDVVGLLIKDAELRDNPPNPDADPNLPPNDLAGRLLQVYNQDQDEVHEIIREMRRVLDEYDDRCGIGEIWFKLPRWIKYYGENNDGLHLPFNFRLMQQPWQARAMRQSVDELEAALPPFAWPNYVLGSHDGPRLASRFGGQVQARVAAMMLLTLRGTPTLYYGDELGLEDGVIPPEKIQDPQGVNLGAERTRDVCRTPMQWDAGPDAGFSAVEPWLPVSADHAARNVTAQSDDPASMLNLYRRLLRYRRGSPALYGGDYRPLDVGDDDCFVYLRTASDERRLIALNFSGDQQCVSVPGEDAGQVVISTRLDREERVSLSRLELGPHEGVIIEL